jgi:hypothetical protein
MQLKGFGFSRGSSLEMAAVIPQVPSPTTAVLEQAEEAVKAAVPVGSLLEEAGFTYSLAAGWVDYRRFLFHLEQNFSAIKKLVFAYACLPN